MKILIVDDELTVKRLFELRFRREIREGKYELYFAYPGAQALTMLGSEEMTDVAFILADINMPWMIDLELLAKIRLEYPNKEIFMVTAYHDSNNREQALYLGATDYLIKPIDFKVLKEKLLSS